MLNLNQRLHVRTVHVCISLCTIVAHNTAQNSCDNLPSYPADNRHCSDAVYRAGGGGKYHNSQMSVVSAIRVCNLNSFIIRPLI